MWLVATDIKSALEVPFNSWAERWDVCTCVCLCEYWPSWECISTVSWSGWNQGPFESCRMWPWMCLPVCLPFSERERENVALCCSMRDTHCVSYASLFLFLFFKWIVHPKWILYHCLLTRVLLQTCVTLSSVEKKKNTGYPGSSFHYNE